MSKKHPKSDDKNPKNEPVSNNPPANDDSNNPNVIIVPKLEDATIENPVDAEARKKKNADLFPDLGGDNDELLDEIDDLRGQLVRMQSVLDRAQRDNATLLTDAENSKKYIQRIQTQAAVDKETAAKDLVTALLPFADALELSVKAIPQADRAADTKFDKLAEGTEKISNMLTAIFNQFGVKAINPVNEPFDEKKHEALLDVAKPGVDKGTVIDVAQKGYEMKGKLLRPAKVIVSK